MTVVTVKLVLLGNAFLNGTLC